MLSYDRVAASSADPDVAQAAVNSHSAGAKAASRRRIPDALVVGAGRCCTIDEGVSDYSNSLIR